MRTVGIIALALIAWAVWFSYTQNGTRFHEKSVWDWMELLIVPAVPAGGGYLLNSAREGTEREIVSDRSREDALQAYLNKVAELLLEKNLRGAAPEDAVRIVARMRTLTALRELDGIRKGILLRFLYEANLIRYDPDPIAGKRVIDLGGADLNGANLGGVDLSGADLSGVNLDGANLNGAKLFDARMYGASLNGTHLSEAKLGRAYLKTRRPEPSRP